MKRKIIIFITIAASLIAVANAQAITKRTATASASGWQHLKCPSVGQNCVNWNLVSSECRGPYKGKIQWNCEGNTLESNKHNLLWCTAETSWSAYNFLVHSYYGCNTSNGTGVAG